MYFRIFFLSEKQQLKFISFYVLIDLIFLFNIRFLKETHELQKIKHNEYNVQGYQNQIK